MNFTEKLNSYIFFNSTGTKPTSEAKNETKETNETKECENEKDICLKSLKALKIKCTESELDEDLSGIINNKQTDFAEKKKKPSERKKETGKFKIPPLQYITVDQTNRQRITLNRISGIQRNICNAIYTL